MYYLSLLHKKQCVSKPSDSKQIFSISQFLRIRNRYLTWVAPLPQGLSQGSSSDWGQGMKSSQGWTWVCWRVCCQIQSRDWWPKSVTSESLDWGLIFLSGGSKPKASLSLLTWVSSWNSSKRDSWFRQSKQRAKRQVTSVGEDVEKTEPLWKCKYLLSVTSVDLNWTCRHSKHLY